MYKTPSLMSQSPTRNNTDERNVSATHSCRLIMVMSAVGFHHHFTPTTRICSISTHSTGSQVASWDRCGTGVGQVWVRCPPRGHQTSSHHSPEKASEAASVLRRSGWSGRLDAAGPRLGAGQPLHHGACVAQATGQLLRAAILLNELEAVRAEVSLLVDICDGSHQWADDNLSVVLEEVDL